FVVAPVADEVAGIAEILADCEKLGPFVTQPQFPMTDDIGIELELGAAPDFSGISIDTDPTCLPSCDEHVIFHAGHTSEPRLCAAFGRRHHLPLLSPRDEGRVSASPVATTSG